MEHYVYILYSSSHNKTYVGYSSNFKERLIFHNTSDKKNHTPLHLGLG
ncbi:GIY-YIG nuclease family protein [Bacteroidia bacterium]|nr:GIY-YIG nuclease family protein [Bacteroidia bacterium]MDB4107006.1 GIY-YIG nuclease family protein [Bacteroidia bacterium]MDB9882466.1 GIY-YIG nuclease family protein [Bacteroidia bacterium]